MSTLRPCRMTGKANRYSRPQTWRHFSLVLLMAALSLSLIDSAARSRRRDWSSSGSIVYAKAVLQPVRIVSSSGRGLPSVDDLEIFTDTVLKRSWPPLPKRALGEITAAVADDNEYQKSLKRQFPNCTLSTETTDRDENETLAELMAKFRSLPSVNLAAIIAESEVLGQQNRLPDGKGGLEDEYTYRGMNTFSSRTPVTPLLVNNFPQEAIENDRPPQQDNAKRVLERREWDPSSWMQDLRSVIYPLTLREMVFPGTHDAGAYMLSGKPVDGKLPQCLARTLDVASKLGFRCISCILRAWGVAQTSSLRGQLDGGIRYLDVRAAWDASQRSWRTHHTLYGLSLAVLLDEIRSFIEANTGEIVLVEISHFDGNPSKHIKADLGRLIVDKLGRENLAPYYHQLANTFRDSTTVGQLVEKGQRLIVGIDCWSDMKEILVANIVASEEGRSHLRHPTTATITTEEGYYLWPTDILFKNTYANSPNLHSMIQYNFEQSTVYEKEYMPIGSASQLFKTSWILTTDANTVLGGLADFRRQRPRNLLQLANTANTHSSLREFILGEQNDRQAKDEGERPGTGELAASNRKTLLRQPKTPIGNILLIDNFETSDIVSLIIRRFLDGVE